MVPPPPEPLAVALSEVSPPEDTGGARRLEEDLRDYERRRIQQALDRVGGHQGKAAENLGISRRTLTNKLTELGLPRPRKGKNDAG